MSAPLSARVSLFPGDGARFPSEAHIRVVPSIGRFNLLLQFHLAEQVQRLDWMMLNRKLTQAYRVEVGNMSRALARAEWLVGY